MANLQTWARRLSAVFFFRTSHLQRISATCAYLLRPRMSFDLSPVKTYAFEISKKNRKICVTVLFSYSFIFRDVWAQSNSKNSSQCCCDSETNSRSCQQRFIITDAVTERIKELSWQSSQITQNDDKIPEALTEWYLSSLRVSKEITLLINLWFWLHIFFVVTFCK